MKKTLFSKKAFSLIELSIVILIIGILVAGITQSSRLVREFRLSSARSLTRSSPVHSIPGVFFWIDATSETAFDSDVDEGSAVQNMYDQNIQTNNNKVNFTQSTLSKRPIYRGDLVNKLPGLSFDGVDDSLESVSQYHITTVSPNNENTFFYVGYFPSTIAFPGYFNFQISGGAERIYFTGFTATARFTYVADITNSITGGNTLGRNLIATLEKKNGTQRIYINGAQTASAANTATFSSFSSNFFIGSQIASTGFARVDVGEVIFFDRALKDEERESIETYLSKKWGIKI
jgi:prepilin-type N-terminal cleavage/methylation domain-containing protein